MFRVLSVLLFFIFSGCSDNSTITFYEKNLEGKKIDCLSLEIFPPDKLIEENLRTLYSFSDSCRYKLQPSKKIGIVCNSPYNSEKKSTNNFPSSYFRIDLYDKETPLYSYYIDLVSEPNSEDIKKAFLRMKKDLSL